MIVLLSAFKFMGGILYSTIFYRMGFIPSVLLTVAGGMIGVYIFASHDHRILNFLQRLFRIKKRNYVKFSRRRRWIVKIKSTYGLAGIAFLTPILLQVPIGTFLAMRMIKDIRKVSLAMLFSFSLYALMFCGLYYGLGPHFRDMMSTLVHH